MNSGDKELIFVSFQNEHEARAALRDLRELEPAAILNLSQAAILGRDRNGSIWVDETGRDKAIRRLLAPLFGESQPPGSKDSGLPHEFLAEAARHLGRGRSAVVAVFALEQVRRAILELELLGGRVTIRPLRGSLPQGQTGLPANAENGNLPARGWRPSRDEWIEFFWKEREQELARDRSRLSQQRDPEELERKRPKTKSRDAGRERERDDDFEADIEGDLERERTRERERARKKARVKAQEWDNREGRGRDRDRRKR